MLKLIQITSNIYNWNARLNEVYSFIQSSSFEEQLILQYCKQAESMLMQYCNIAIIENTYKMIGNCGEDLTKKYKSLVLKTEFCDDLINLDVEYLAGYDIDNDDILWYDILTIIKGLYNNCDCLTQSILNKYRVVIQEVENNEACCGC